ncbi:MAG TPA: hypothetical protein VGK21_05150 [Candidatus Angelobacter sp.]
MARKKKNKSGPADGLWVSPRSFLKAPNAGRAWENRPGGLPNSSRFLELADLALGLKKPAPRKKREVEATHATAKTDPYSEPINGDRRLT